MIHHRPARFIICLAVCVMLLAGAANASLVKAAGDNLVQTAINGRYDSTRGTLTLHRVESSRTAAGVPAALVRNLAFAKSFDEIFAASKAAPLATLVAHDGAGDGRRSYHLVHLREPRFIQSTNSITYSIELLNPLSPPPETIDRVFLVFVPSNLTAITDPEPLTSPDDIAASDLVEAVSTETISSGAYDASTNLLSLRGVEHILLASEKLLHAAKFPIADIANDLEELYRKSFVKPVAVFAWRLCNAGQQAVVRLEDFDFDVATSEVRYAVTVLESSQPLPKSFGVSSLTIPAVLSFGRGWPAHSVCCNCNFKCSVLWVLGYCKTCVSPLGGDKCCETCRIPPSPGQTCPLSSDGQGLVTFNNQLILGFLSSQGTRELRVTSSKDGKNFISPVTVPKQLSNREPGMTAFGNIVVKGYKANDSSNTLWTTLSSDGVDFVGAFPVTGQESPDPPALTVFQKLVRMGYRANDGSNQLYLTSSGDGKIWGRRQEGGGTIESSQTGAHGLPRSFTVGLRCQ